MNTEKYWKQAARRREEEAHEEAEKALKEMLSLYDGAAADIKGEINKITVNYARRFGLDDKTAKLYLSRSVRENDMDDLAQMLLDAQSDEERRAILDFIQRDGLSTRAYGARAARYTELGQRIELRVIKLEMALGRAGEQIRRSVYKNNYYRVIDDTAKELNAGLSFTLIDDAALDEVMKKPWHGKRFSKRIWDNTERLAKEAREIAGRYIVSGRSLDKAAQEIAEAFEVEKFHAATLIHTEVAHARSMSDTKAYEEIGAEEYKYLATLDELTCGVCAPLDGQTFRLDERREGVNYPVMHPRCRCTTTIAGDFKKRRARDMITGKNTVIDGNVTYEQWRGNMTEEEKAAFEKAGRSYRNGAADMKQLERYRERLGSKNLPRSLDKWQELKYTDSEKYEGYKSIYKNATGFIEGGLNLKTNKPRQIITVNHTDVRGIPNTVTQITNAKGGIDRNYYGEDGLQIKQISNNDHGHKKESGYGKHGEHAHDYIWNKYKGNFDREIRDLNADERKENKDIL